MIILSFFKIRVRELFTFLHELWEILAAFLWVFYLFCEKHSLLKNVQPALKIIPLLNSMEMVHIF